MENKVIIRFNGTDHEIHPLVAKSILKQLKDQIREIEEPVVHRVVSLNEKRLQEFYTKAIPYLQEHADFLQLVGNFPVHDHLTRLIHMHVIDKAEEKTQ